MAWTVGKEALPELSEADVVLDDKARQLADLIRSSKHFIVFTGAGVSTSAGIPDFRGPEGQWTLQAQGRQRTTAAVSSLQAIPTATHMALVELQNQGILKYLVSQNCDGLHRRSGILPDKISEVHGNNTREVCKDCGREYIRDFRAVADNTKHIHDHRTGRKCTVCNGALHDTIINFNEFLPARELQLARDHARQADLCLALGSSLTIPPANEIPETVGRKRGTRRGAEAGKLVICNLQETPLDNLATLRVHAKTDELMVRVIHGLGLEIPEFVLRRRLAVTLERNSQRGKVTVAGVDVDGTPVSFLQSVKMEGTRRVLRAEPFVFDLRGEGSVEKGLEIKLVLEFMGHYGEPNLELDHNFQGADAGAAAVYLLEYKPYNGEWTASVVQ